MAIEGGPPVRGTKLIAWQFPPIWKDLQENGLSVPEGSGVPQNQSKMVAATKSVLTAIAADMRDGLLETVGVESELSLDDGRCSMILKLSEKSDTHLIARAIDAENVEAWRDERGQVHVAISPWYSTKDVDQAVLCTIKIVHVLLGLHAADKPQTQSLKQKLLASVRDVMLAKKEAGRKKS